MVDMHNSQSSSHYAPASQLTTAFLGVVSSLAMNGGLIANVAPQRTSSFVEERAGITVALTTRTQALEGAAITSTTSEVQTEIVPGPTWLKDSLDRIDRLGSLPENWCGDGFARASEECVGDAERFLLKLAHVGYEASPPAIGLDDDGSFSFHFADKDFIADLSIHPDGTYSYYAQRDGWEIFADSRGIVGQIDPQLARILVG